MITMTNFGNNGRLGNQLFQYASSIGISIHNKVPIVLPEWKYSNIFSSPYPYSKTYAPKYNESSFTFKEINQENADLDGYFQSEKYWEDSKDIVKKQFTFKEEFVRICKTKLHYIDWDYTIAIHIRRGDYVGNICYYQLPIAYYLFALEEQFPDWRDYNLVFFSDDIEYCKIHFGCLSNAIFPNLEDIEDLCLMTQCKHFLIGNSTFGWWGAYLGRKEDSKIVRPNYHFAGQFLKENNWKDYYPNDWTVFDHKDKKIDLSDVTFLIPVHYDHEDRKENLQLCINYLQANFKTNILIGEQGSEEMNHFAYIDYINFNSMPYFHRTKILNKLCKFSETPIIVNQDCDVFIPPLQIIQAVDFIRAGVDVSYPYDGRFSGIKREDYKQSLGINNDIGIVKEFKAKGNQDGNKYATVGGCIIFSKKAFVDGGMENENFVSWGAEDAERYERFRKLRYSIERVYGCLYHLEHYVGINSSAKNPFFLENDIEYNKVKRMTEKELKEYVKTWKWKD